MGEPYPSTYFRRIVVALDASRHSEAALEAAARLCAVFGAELRGVFVEDLNVLRAAELPFTMDVGRLARTSVELSGYGVRRMFRVQQARAQRAFEWAVRQHRLRNEFVVVSGNVAEQLIDAADEADLITLGQSGSEAASRRKLGTVTLTVLARSRGPVLVLRRGLRLDLPVMVVYDCEAQDRDDALGVAADLARVHRESPLVVLLAGVSLPECDVMQAELAGRLSGPTPVAFERIQRDVPELVLERAHRRRAGLLVVPADGHGGDLAHLRSLVGQSDVPVMVVRAIRARGRAG
jgi:nucleotide-binding universal stress UspA family protein